MLAQILPTVSGFLCICDASNCQLSCSSCSDSWVALMLNFVVFQGAICFQQNATATPGQCVQNCFYIGIVLPPFTSHPIHSWWHFFLCYGIHPTLRELPLLSLFYMILYRLASVGQTTHLRVPFFSQTCGIYWKLFQRWKNRILVYLQQK